MPARRWRELINTEILRSSNRLLPDAACTRAQLVTLLYRLESQTTDRWITAV